MNWTRYVCTAGVALAISASCSDRSTPTSTSALPSAESASTRAVGDPASAYGDSNNVRPARTAYDDSLVEPSAALEEFNCTNVQQVYVRFSDPGYVLDNAVGLHTLMVGMPAGRKLLRVWWDYENRADLYQDIHIGEGEVQRYDDSLFDYQGVIEHAYQGVTAPTDYRVRVEMMILDKTGNCARVRDVTVSPGDRTTASASELIVNGGFETGDFSGWMTSDAGAGAFYVYSGTSTPVSSQSVLPPPQATFAAVTDQSGPGTHILYQDVTIPGGVTASLSAVVYVNNTVGAYFDAGDLDYSGVANQQMRVDVMNPGAALDDVGAGVLLNLFETNPGDPASIGYTTIAADLSAFAGQTVRIRIATVDNQGVFNGSVDAVSLTVTR